VNENSAAESTAAVESSSVSGFAALNLHAAVLRALTDVGYEMPTPIQAATIPPLLAGTDVLGQAQTGTGKTAAFALPVLSRIDIDRAQPQALVLVPTRELAIQVAEAFQSYAAHLPNFHVLPIYGGQSYTPQIKGLKRGAHVIVGTPGRVMDHMKRGTLDLSGMSFLVLDEADEMLQMGFVDDIEWILEQSPPTRQVALFSATLPPPIRRIAQKHLRDPAEITIKSKTTTSANIRQRYWLVSGLHKLDALTRILEVESFDGMLIFVRTKLETVELAERLQARGFDAAALNGDIHQQQRERTINALKAGQVDIVVATDVAARGLDVERVSHVVNYDVPYDSESYVHRIGRTGRAGRSGEAILFIAPRERNMLRIIERATRQPIEQMRLPSIADVNEQRVTRFKQRIIEAVAAGEGAAYRELVEQFESEQNIPAIEIAAALASLAQGGTPLLLPEKGEGWGSAEESGAQRAGRREEREQTRRERRAERFGERGERPGRREREDRFQGREERSARDRFEERSVVEGAKARSDRDRRFEGPEVREAGAGVEPGEAMSGRGESRDFERPARREREEREAPRKKRGPNNIAFETFRIEVGHVHGVKPGNIVGAIANEAGLEGRHIGQVDIHDDHSFVDLPEGMPKEIFRSLKKVVVLGQELQITYANGKAGGGGKGRGRPGRGQQDEGHPGQGPGDAAVGEGELAGVGEEGAGGEEHHEAGEDVGAESRAGGEGGGRAGGGGFGGQGGFAGERRPRHQGFEGGPRRDDRFGRRFPGRSGGGPRREFEGRPAREGGFGDRGSPGAEHRGFKHRGDGPRGHGGPGGYSGGGRRPGPGSRGAPGGPGGFKRHSGPKGKRFSKTPRD
jgi:ATP-dependent RNA helicase DeaD